MPPPNRSAQPDLAMLLSRQTAAVALQVQRLKKSVYRLEAIEAVQSAGRKPVYPIEFRSQFGEDALLWELFRGQLDGFFIEVGAFDGYSFAVTYALECLGWKGAWERREIPRSKGLCWARRWTRSWFDRSAR